MKRRYELKVTWPTSHGAELELVAPDGFAPFARNGDGERMRQECLADLAAPLIAAELRRLAADVHGGGIGLLAHDEDDLQANRDAIQSWLRARADQLDPP